MRSEQKKYQKPSALINYGFIPTTDDFRSAKLAAREDLRCFSSNKLQRECGVAPMLPVRVKMVKGKFRHDATIACKNRNSCPWCSTRFMADHRSTIMAKAIHAIDIGGGFVSAVFTLPNRHGHDLRFAYKTLRAQAARFRRMAKTIEATYGVTGSVRVYEETYGELLGWHPHVNYVWFTSSKLSETERGKLESKLVEAWLTSARNGGISGVSASAQWIRTQGSDSEAKQTARYVAKHSYYLKSKPVPNSNGKYFGLEPWQVLDLARTGDVKWIKVWQGYEAGVKGLHRVTYLP